MNKPKISKIVNNVKATARHYTPQILTGIGIGGMATTVVLAVKATPKALQLIEEEKYTQNKENLTAVETVKVAWKPYIPAAVTGVMSTACLIGSTKISTGRTAALATAYEISKTALSEYKEKVVEVIGEKKEQKIRDEIAKDHIEKNPVTKTEVIMTKNGDVLCLDDLSGRYFKSSMNQINKAENHMNYRMRVNDYISLNELYDELDISPTTLGDKLGWNIEDGELEINVSAQVSDNDEPCLVLYFDPAPRYEYSKMT